MAEKIPIPLQPAAVSGPLVSLEHLEGQMVFL